MNCIVSKGSSLFLSGYRQGHSISFDFLLSFIHNSENISHILSFSERNSAFILRTKLICFVKVDDKTKAERILYAFKASFLHVGKQNMYLIVFA